MRKPQALSFALVLSLSLLGASPGAAVVPYLVADINPEQVGASSTPQSSVRIGSTVLFDADDGETGRELWRSDGTTAGTYRLVDACPGPCSGRAFLFWPTESLYFFIAIDEGFGEDLWVTDGTPAGTVQLTEGLDFPAGIAQVWVPEQKLLYFSANDGAHGQELWRTDGTPAGTFQVTDLRPGAAGSNPGHLASFKGRLFYCGNDGRTGSALWTSDGTPQGTRLVSDPWPGASLRGGPYYLRVAGRYLFFLSESPARGGELWRTDGTPKGTVPVADLAPGKKSTIFVDLKAFGSRLLFIADDGRRGQELWITDGTLSGTRALTSLHNPSPFGVAPSYYYLPWEPLGGRLLLPLDDGEHGWEIWTTNGTAAGTRLLKDLCPGPCSGSTSIPGVIGNRAFFSGNDGKRGDEPWVTDGTAADTRLVKDICPGPCNSHFGRPVAIGNRLFYRGSTSSHGDEFWITDGTPRGTTRVTDFVNPDAFDAPFPFFGGISLGAAYLFVANDGPEGLELWRTDGTRAGTYLLRDINPMDTGGSFPTFLRAVGDRLFFFADDGLHGSELLA